MCVSNEKSQRHNLMEILKKRNYIKTIKIEINNTTFHFPSNLICVMIMFIANKLIVAL